MRRKGISLVEVLVVIAIIGIMLAVLLPWFAKSRESTHCCACANNLKQLGLVMSLYANDNNDIFPPIDNRKNNFIFDANLVYPNYLTDLSILVCPHDQNLDADDAFRLRREKSSLRDVNADCVTDTSYCYLGWMIMNENEAEAFFEAYDRLSPEEYAEDIEVPDEKGIGEPLIIRRLSSGVDRFLVTDSNEPGPLESVELMEFISTSRLKRDLSCFSN